MASNGENMTLERRANQPTTISSKVRQLIDTCKGKTEWYMRVQLLTDVDVREIVNELKVDDKCEELHLNNNHITVIGVGYLAELLKDNRTLKILNLKNNPLGDEGVQCLCEALTLYNALKGLNLSNTGMTYKSGVAVAKMIEKTHTLVKLDLRQKQRFPPLTERRIMEANKIGKIDNLFFDKTSDEEYYSDQE